MRITKELPQFDDEQALLIVSGKEEAIVYTAHAGTITRVEHVRYRPHRYSDREGFFAIRSGGKTVRSGSAKEIPKQHSLVEFLTALQTALRPYVAKPKSMTVYLFAPKYLLPSIREHLSSDIRQQIRKSVPGNFVNDHPFEILEYLLPLQQTRTQRNGRRKA